MSEGNWQTVTKKTRKPITHHQPVQTYNDEPKKEEDVLVLRKKNRPPTTKQVKAASQSQKVTETGVNVRILDNNTSGGSHKKVGKSLAQIFQRALTIKGLTQKELVTKVGGKAGVNAQDIQKIAAGTAIMNVNKINAIERALNIRLLGKNIGEPFFKPKQVKK